METSKRKFGNLLIILLFVISSANIQAQYSFSFSPSASSLGDFITITITSNNMNFTDNPSCVCPNCHYVNTSNIVLAQYNSSYYNYSYINPYQINVISSTVVEADFAFDASHSAGDYNLVIGFQGICEVTGFDNFHLDQSITISNNVFTPGTSLSVTFTGLGVEFGQVSETCYSYWTPYGNFEFMAIGANTIEITNNTDSIASNSISNLAFYYTNNNNYTSQFDASFFVPTNLPYGYYDIIIHAAPGCELVEENAVLIANDQFSYSPTYASLGDSTTLTISSNSLNFSDDTSCICSNCLYVSTSNICLMQNNSSYNSNHYIFPYQVTLINSTTVEASFAFDSSHPVGNFKMIVGYQTPCENFSDYNLFQLNSSLSITPINIYPNTSHSITISGLGVEFGLFPGTCSSYWNIYGGFDFFPLGANDIEISNGNISIEPDSIANLTFNYIDNNNYISQFDAFFNIPAYATNDYYDIVLEHGSCEMTKENVVYINDFQLSFNPNIASLGDSSTIIINSNTMNFSANPNCNCPNCHYVTSSNICLVQSNDSYGTSHYIFPYQINVIDSNTVEASFAFDSSHPVGNFKMIVGYQTACEFLSYNYFHINPSFSISPNITHPSDLYSITVSGLGIEFSQVPGDCYSYWNMNGEFDFLPISVNNIGLINGYTSIQPDSIANLTFNYTNNTNYISQFDAFFNIPLNSAYGYYDLVLGLGSCQMIKENIVNMEYNCNASFDSQLTDFEVDLNLSYETNNFNSVLVQYDFGDGTIVTGNDNVSHMYSVPGTYEANCIVNYQTNLYSCIDTFSETINISCSILHITTSLNNPAFYSFNNNIPINEYSLVWDFSNGDIMVDTLTGFYQYNYFGDYEISLTLTNLIDTSKSCILTNPFSYSPSSDSISSVTLKPNAAFGKDAMIVYNDLSANYGTSPNLNIYSYLMFSEPYHRRSLIQFDIPSFCAENDISSDNIISAKIKLFHNPNISNGYSGGPHYIGSIASVSRITEFWHEDFVTWFNQPSHDVQTSIIQYPINSYWSSINFDVTDHAKHTNSYPYENYGFLIEIHNDQQEQGRCVFASSDHINNLLHPEFTIDYYVPTNGLPEQVIYCPGDTVSISIIEGYSTYEWSTGETGTSIQVYDSGYYFIEFSDFNGNTYNDSVHLYIGNNNYIESISENLEIGTAITLDPGANFVSYSWYDGSTGQEKIVLDEGVYTISLITQNNCLVSTDFHVFLQQTIELSDGWSLISSCLNPSQTSFDSIFSELNNLVILKNQMGLVYYPSFNINQIGSHTVGEGYQIKMEMNETLILTGSLVSPENTSIYLNSGWNIIAYLHPQSSLIETALSEIIGNIEILKNDDGQVYWPAYGIDLIGEMHASEGYQIKVTSTQNFSYSEDCFGYFIDERDGQTYEMVSIGNQCWMAENLNVGEWILANNPGQSWDQIIEKYCYVDDANNCELYGGLYKWNELMQNSTQESVQGICPNGWHIPSDYEWYILENFVDSTINDSTIEGWRGVSAGIDLGYGGSTNFEAVGKGYFHISYYDFSSSYFFTSSEKTGTAAFCRTLNPQYFGSFRGDMLKETALSVRCVRD